MKNLYFLFLLFSIAVNAQLTSTMVVTNANCIDLGTAQVQSIGGVAPYIYSLNNNPFTTANTFVNLQAGTYLLITKDANNDTTTINFIITTIPPITISVGLGFSSDSVFLNAVGGFGNYLFSIDNGTPQSSNLFINIPIGLHNFTAIDSNNCTAVVTYTIVASAIVSTTTSTNVLCFGDTTGSITIGATGGQAPFIYKVDNVVVPNSTVTGLAAGNYDISVTDQLGFVNSRLATILEPAQLLVNTSIANSDIVVNATGGTPPYQYGLDFGVFQSSNTFTNLPTGNYSVQTLDANGCAFNLVAVVNVAPPVINNQSVASVNFPNAGNTLADIIVQGSNILWYSNQGTGNFLNRKNLLPLDAPLPLSTVVQNNTTYYASQTINGFESQQRLPVTVTIGAILSSNNIIFESFKYYPNPVKNTFLLSNNSFEIQEITIGDLSGKTLISKNINDFETEIDFTNLSNGMYLVKVKSNDSEKTIKVLKNN